MTPEERAVLEAADDYDRKHMARFAAGNKGASWDPPYPTVTQAWHDAVNDEEAAHLRLRICIEDWRKSKEQKP